MRGRGTFFLAGGQGKEFTLDGRGIAEIIARVGVATTLKEFHGC